MSEREVFAELLRRIRKAHRRCCMVTLADLFTRTLFYLAIVCALILAALALTPLELNRLWLASGSLALSIPIALGLFLLRPIPLNAAALIADKQLRLKEKISSALEFGANLSPDREWREWQSAVLRDALHETNRLDLNKAFPWPKPREGRWMWAPMLALLLAVFVLPQWNLFGGPSAASADALEQNRLERELAQFEKQAELMMERREHSERRQETAELSREVKELIQELSKGRVEQREALAKLSDLQEKWEQRREQLSQRRPNMGGANQPLQNKMLGQMMQDLKDGQFDQARQKMEELQKQMKMDSLDQSSLERLGQELQQMAAMMGLNTPLAQAMQNAGEALEGDPHGDGGMAMMEMIEMELDDLLDMLEQMALMDELLQNLEETKQSLSGQCKDCGGPTDRDGNCQSGECQGGECPECGGGNCAGGACSGSGQGNGPPRGEGSSPWAEGETDQSSGGGMGGPGQGAGGQAPFEETETELTPERLRSGFHAAPIQGILPIDGEASPADSAMGFSGGGGAIRQAAEEAITREGVPVPYRNRIRAYFDTLSPSVGDGD